MTVSVATYDPGGWVDNFCGLFAKVTPENIRLTDAKFWNKKDMPNLTTQKIKDDIAKIHNAFKFDYTLCETNNQGNMIISDLRSYPYKIPVIGITTSANLKTRQTLQRGSSLDKAKTVPYVQKFIEDGIIEFPKYLTPGLKQMKGEIDNYGQKDNGKFEALSGHDDSISCLVILTHWAKRSMLRATASTFFGIGAGDPYDGYRHKPVNEQVRDMIEKRFENSGYNTADMRINYRRGHD